MKQLGLAPILIVLLVALLGIGGYFAYTSLRGGTADVAISPTINSTPKPTESTSSADTANWKTYTNTKYGFELKYPSNLEIANGSVDYISYIQTAGWSTNKATLPTSYQIEITYLKDKVYTPEEYMKLDSDKIPPLPKPDFMQTTTNGISTITKTYKDESSFAWGGNKQYYLYQNNKGIILNGSGKNHQLLDQILSTFKFTN